MSVLSAYQQGFLDELEKMARAPVKETRKGWLSSKSRVGRRPLRVSTLLKKEKDGTLGGYKLAEVLLGLSKVGTQSIVPFTETENGGEAKPARKPGDVPSREDTESTPRREDGRGSAHTLLPVGTTLTDIAAVQQPERAS